MIEHSDCGAGNHYTIISDNSSCRDLRHDMTAGPY